MIGMRRRGAQRLPRGIRDGGGIAVEIRLLNGRDRSPERVLSLPIPPGNEAVGHDHVHERVQPRRLVEVVPLVRLQDAGDAAPGVVRRLEPEMRDVRLVGRPCRAGVLSD